VGGTDTRRLAEALEEIHEKAERFGLDGFPMRYEICPADVLYTFGAYGMPARFSHWSFGKSFHRMKTQYDYNLSRIYELVINSDPCYAFLLESNSLLQNKVIAAHVLAHSDFFRHNYRFAGTSRSMLETMAIHAARLRRYEMKYGRDRVEQLLDAVLALQEQGVIQHLGIASGPVELTRQFLATGVFEVVLNHNRYTLVDRSAEPLIQDAYDRGVGFVNAAPYGGGILVKGPEAQPRYAYRSPSDAVLGAVHGMRRVCAAHRIPLAAAALQFSLRDRRIAATVVGVSSPERITATLDLACREIPAAVWDELAALAPGPEHWLH